MLSKQSTFLLYALAVLYGVLGVILFVAPAWGSANFAWRVSPFVAMTIGGWCLGNAWAAFIIARRSLPTVATAVLYLILFGVLQTIVLVMFRERVLPGNHLSWIYFAALAANCLFAVSALIDVFRQPATALARVGRPLRPIDLIFVAGFIFNVGFLGVGLFFGPVERRLIGSPIFPEPLSPFTVRSFGAFYLALSASVILLFVTRGLGNALGSAFAASGLVLFVTAAAFVYIGLFDFRAFPTQLIYFAAYLIVGILACVYFAVYGTGKDQGKTATSG